MDRVYRSRYQKAVTVHSKSASPSKFRVDVAEGCSDYQKADKQITRFQLALNSCGIAHRVNRRSIIIKECPSCHKQWKLWMFRPDPNKGGGMTGGQCWRCGTSFSSFTLLQKMTSLSNEKIAALISPNKRYTPDLEKTDIWELPDFFLSEELRDLEENIKEIDIPKNFMTVDSYREHPASIYARKRGIIPPYDSSIFIDPLTASVAFPILCQDFLVGFQRRFIAPLNPNLRMKTDSGVPRASSFIFVGEPSSNICVVEGPFDAVAAAWFGFYAIATMGKEITRAQAQEIASYAIQHAVPGISPVVHIGLDSDSAGEEGARTLARYLNAYGIPFCRVFPEDPGIKDFNDLLLRIVNPLEMTEAIQIDPRGIVRFKRDWGWDLPIIGDVDFYKFISATTDKKIIESARSWDNTITNKYTWKDVRDEKTKKKIRQFMENPAK
jgi:hypothetical protein